MIATAYAQIPDNLEITEDAVPNQQIANLETTRVIFFAMDAIPDREKNEMPTIKGAGGMYLPQIKTMPKLGAGNGSRGMLYKCRLTPLKTKRIHEWNVMLSPEARKNWDKSYIQTVVENGETAQKTISGFLGSDPQATREGEFKNKRSDHNVYKKRYPGEDITFAVQRSLPNGVGGVVEIVALRRATATAIKEAQLFFFPEWGDIEHGHKMLPATVREIEEHLNERIKQISFQLWSDKQKADYFSIGRDMLRSCSEFRRSATDIVERDTTAYKTAFAKGETGVTHSHISEFLLNQLETRRKDDIVAGDSSSVDRLARVMEARESQDAEFKRRELELKEREIALREREAALKEAELQGNVVTMPKGTEIKVGSGDIKVTEALPFIGVADDVQVIATGETGVVVSKHSKSFKVLLEDKSEKMFKREALIKCR